MLIPRLSAEKLSAIDVSEEQYAFINQAVNTTVVSLDENGTAIEEEEQREVASLFNTKLIEPETPQEKEKAFNDILTGVKRISYEYNSGQLGTDVEALKRVIEGKKALEELSKTHISLES